MALDENVSSYSDDARVTQKQVDLVPDSDVSGYILLTHGDLPDTSVVPITTVEMLRKQQTDRFCSNLVARLQNGKDMLFSQNKDGSLFRLEYGDEQVVV